MSFQRANILLPKFSLDPIKMQKWSVIACDQYTSEPSYWSTVDQIVGEAQSTFHLTVPEIYLNDPDIDDKIANTNKAMVDYIQNEVFEEYENTYIFIERTLANGVKRFGIVGMVDLEDYDYTSAARTKIRATEGTVVSRIPPRLKVRYNALVELPHIMMLIDDETCEIVESNSQKKDSFEKLYDFDLMQNSGHIAGYKMSDEACIALDEKLAGLSNLNQFNQKYGVQESTPLIYAMGDGNHSLATAKAYYEQLKQEIGEEQAKNSAARYALCELVNLHDASLVFEAIHRVVFGADGAKFLQALGQKFEISLEEDAVGQSFVLVSDGKQQMVTILNPEEYLTVATIQKFMDEYVSEHGGEIDYIHGADVVFTLCEEKENFGILLNAMDKKDLYKSVILDGALPRKTFSMGEACDKRFYIEARKIK